MKRIIELDKSIIPACDVPFNVYKRIIDATSEVQGVGGYKIGVAFLDIGIKGVVDYTRDHSDKPIIYDHQKAGTDIPDTGEAFMDTMVRAGVDAVILFPQAGPATQYNWTKAAQERELGVIVGGEMTHPRYLEGDTSNGKKIDYDAIFEELGFDRDLTGNMRDSAPDDIYELAARMGVTDFVVPGNKPDRIAHYKNLIKQSGVDDPAFYAPGLITQGGNISDGAKAAGKRFHGIVGRGIFKADDMQEAALEHTSQI